MSAMDGVCCGVCGASLAPGPDRPVISSLWARGAWWCRACAHRFLGVVLEAAPPAASDPKARLPAGVVSRPIAPEDFDRLIAQAERAMNADHPPFFIAEAPGLWKYVGRTKIRGWG